MEQRNRSIILREVLGSASSIFLIAAGVSICNVDGAFGLATSGVEAPVTTSITFDEADLGGNLDVPAPAANYDLPAESGSVADPDSDSQAVNADNVLELPRVLEPFKPHYRHAGRH
jgi:hypothetical protein